jgi:hypothetical protein
MTDKNSILYKVGVAVKEAVGTVQASIPDYLDGSGGSTGSGTGGVNGGYDDFLAGFGVGGDIAVGGTSTSGTLEASVHFSSQILTSTPINPSGEATMKYAIDTEDLYVYDGSAWVKYEND